MSQLIWDSMYRGLCVTDTSDSISDRIMTDVISRYLDVHKNAVTNITIFNSGERIRFYDRMMKESGIWSESVKFITCYDRAEIERSMDHGINHGGYRGLLIIDIDLHTAITKGSIDPLIRRLLDSREIYRTDVLGMGNIYL